MNYVDGYVLPMPTKSVAAYRRIAQKAAKVWLKHGALAYHECVGDDLNIKGVIGFPKLAGAKKGETVIFAWVVFKSRAHRDKVNAKVMKDPLMANMGPMDVPFDPARMAYSGFKEIVRG